MVLHPGAKRGTSIPLVIAAALLAFWGYTARWSTLRCGGETCVYGERRVLTFPMSRKVILRRALLGAHPERLRVQVYDSNHGGADLVIDTTEGVLRIDEGNTRAMTTRADELRLALGGSSPIDASVSPHPFGLLVMGVLALIVFVGLARFIRTVRG